MGKTVKFVQGNEACLEAALYAGLNFFAGYPITPSTEIAEHLASRLPSSLASSTRGGGRRRPRSPNVPRNSCPAAVTAADGEFLECPVSSLRRPGFDEPWTLLDSDAPTRLRPR